MKNALREKWMRLLLADPASPLAERYLALDPALAEFLFGLAERLDEESRRAALRLLDLGPALVARGGRDLLARLATLAERAGTVSGELACRALETGGPVLESLSREQSERWLAMGVELARASERAGRAYFEASATLVTKSPGLDPQVWGSAALPLLESGWQARQLAAQFLEKTAPHGAALGAEGLGLLADSAARIARRHTPLASAWLDEGPRLLAQAPPGTRQGILELLQAAASKGPAAAFAELARRAVALACAAPPKMANAVLQVAGSLYGEEPEQALDLVREGPALLARPHLGRADPWKEGLDLVLEEALALRGQWPAAAAALVRALGELRRIAAPSEIPAWVDEGRRLAVGSPERAAAYFSLASRASRAQLSAFSEGVAYADISRPMALFAQGLCGRHVPLGVLSAEGEPPMPAGRPLPTTDGLKIFLPELTWGFGGRPENRRAVRVATAHQAGHFEFATFAFDARRLARRRSPIADLAQFEPPPGAPGGLSWFFGRFPLEALARDFFAAFEGYRIDWALGRSYPGLAKEIEWLWALERGRRPPLLDTARRGGPLSLLCELLVRRSLGAKVVPTELAGERPPEGEPTEEWPLRQLELSQLWDDLEGFLATLAQPESSVEDSAQRTAELYRLAALFLGTGARGQGAEAQMATADKEETGPRPLEHSVGEIAPQAAGAYEGFEPVPHRGSVDPAAAQERAEGKDLLGRIERAEPALGEMSQEEFQAFLAAHPELAEAAAAIEPGQVTGGVLVDGLPDPEEPARDRRPTPELSADPELLARLKEQIARRMLPDESAACDLYLYDEWDHTIEDYRAGWCTVREQEGGERATEEMERVLAESAEIVGGVIRQFERIRPELLRRERAQPDGEEIDLDRTIEARADRRMGRPWPERLYERRAKAERDVATLLLIDMSASTGERVPDDAAMPASELPPTDADYWWERPTGEAGSPGGAPLAARTVLDIEKEALLVMSKALEYLGDAYAIYGFSGHGRGHVELFRIKGFGEPHGQRVLRRMAGIRPRQSTRMGAAIRHSTWLLSHVEARYKSLIILSDGYPQDTDYGADRRDETYALLDTRAAITESEKTGIHPFCVTVDKAGYDYLRKMSPHETYLVVSQVADLPRVLPRVYRRMTR